MPPTRQAPANQRSLRHAPAPYSERTSTTPSIERFFQFSLLGLVACAFCALADTGRLDPPSLAFLLAGLCWRGLMTLGLARLRIPQRLITLLATAYIVFYPIDFYFISHDFFAATAHGVCFLGVARVLSARSNRDYLYTGSLAFVALMGAAALSTQLRFLGWLAGAVICGLAALTSAEIRRGFQRSELAVPVAGARTGWRLALLVGGAACGILVLTAGLFLIVPRTARAAAMLFPNGPRLTGFTNSIDLGGFGPIAKDDRPVLHIRSTGASLPPNLKWRGSTLSQFDGRHWTEPQLRGQFQKSIEVADQLQRSRLDGARMLYRVDVVSSDTGALFIAGIPEFIRLVPDAVAPTQLMRTAGDSFRAIPALGQPLSYEVSALNGAPLPHPLALNERRRYLNLPAGLDPRIPELGRSWSGAGDEFDRASRIERHLRNDFTYSLEGTPADAVSLPGTSDPLARFLFTTKRGYCEYFASAMAVILRSQGIPARVAMGFQGGYFNDVSGYLVLRASDAHAWVEAWIDGRGWLTFDPTPQGVDRTDSGWLNRVNMYLDAADTAWQRWVVSYNPAQQAALALAFERRLKSLSRSEGAGWSGAPGEFFVSFLARGAAVLALLSILAVGAIFGSRLQRNWNRVERMRKIRRGEATADDAVLLYERMLSTMARRGFQKPAWFTPLEFARNLPERERGIVDTFTLTYNRVRFGGDPGGASRMAEILADMESVR